MTTEERTVGKWLSDLANAVISTESDSSKMQNLLRRIGFPKAVVTIGVVYPEGSGKPVSIHSMAKMITELKED